MICTFSRVDQKQKSDVAIVLGAQTNDGIVSLVYQERLNHAIKLYNDGYINSIIVTGGTGDGNNVSDAKAAKDYAVLKGMPSESIIVEDKSGYTHENLINAKKIIDSKKLETAIVVSDPLHQKRAMLVAEDVGINAYSSPSLRGLEPLMPYTCQIFAFLACCP